MAFFIGSTTPLSANANTVIGIPRPVDRYDRITGSCFASHSGTLYIEQSADWDPLAQTGNWDASTSIAITGGTGTAVSVELVCPWVRARYVNGGTNQTALRIALHGNAAGVAT